MAARGKNQALIETVKKSKSPVPWCDEFEKMVSGMVFDASNVQVMLDHKIKILRTLHSFNDTSIPDDSTIQSLKERRMGILENILGNMGVRVNIETPFFFGWACNIFIGEGVYINREVSMYDNAPVHIGNNVLIGPGVCICTGTHDIAADVRREGGSFAYPIVIEDDCWVGANVTVLPGVKIGRGTTVAAGAVVTKDVEANCLVGGVPAEVIRRLA